MANDTEYIFEKDFWGNWKLVPKKSDSGIGWLIIFLILAVIICLAIITLPFWISLLGFKMVKEKRYYSGVGSLLALMYFIIDIQNRWLSGFLFLGYVDSVGEITQGLIGEKAIMYVYILNCIGAIIGLIWIVQAYLINNENNISNSNRNALNNSNSPNNRFKTPSNQTFLMIGILCSIFSIAIILFSFNKNESNNETQTNIVEEIIIEQPIITESQNSNSNQVDLIEEEYKEEFSVADVLNLVNQYYYDVSKSDFNAEKYFSNNVSQFINIKNLSPIDINNIIDNNSEYLNGKSTLINNEINFERTENTINYYNYWIEYECYRKSKNKYQNCKIKVEIGLDDENKIISYIELEVIDLEFISTEDSNERDPRAKDVANVFFNSNYTLFDFLTDEPIFPNSEGQYDIWYSSNEDPSPYNIVLNKNILSSHRYYKFKTKANCEQWCNEKNGY